MSTLNPRAKDWKPNNEKFKFWESDEPIEVLFWDEGREVWQHPDKHDNVEDKKAVNKWRKLGKGWGL